MKAKNLLRKIVPLAMLLALMIIVVISCKKKDDTPTPTPPGPIPDPTRPVLFVGKFPNMKTKYEKDNNAPFIGHTFRAFGKGVRQEGEDSEIPQPYKFIGKTLWEIHGYRHTKMVFKEAENALANITNQITVLDTMVYALGQEIAVEASALVNYFNTVQLKIDMKPITNQNDSSTHDFYAYYPMMGRQYQADPAGFGTAMENAKEYLLSNYCNNMLQPAISNSEKALHDDLLGLGGPSQNSAMHLYNADLVRITRSAVHDSASAMIAYQMLENYFMWVVGTQFYGCNVFVNCGNVIDSTGSGKINYDFLLTFNAQIQDEVKAFLKEVDWFVVHMDDYRNSNRWYQDAQYADYGLAPDNIWFNALARAQFLANSLYAATGGLYPYYCGKIIIPGKYASGGSGQVPSISFSNPNKTLVATPVVYGSAIPNTTWQPTNPAIASWDTLWAVYTFGSMGQADPILPPFEPNKGSLNLICSNFTTPWAYSVPIQGYLNALWINPQDLNDTKMKYDSIHSMLFGFFSGNWKWGYLYFRWDNNYAVAHQNYVPELTYDYACKYNSEIKDCDGNKGFAIMYFVYPPFVTGCNSDWHVCFQDYTNYLYDAIVDGSFQMGYNGPAFNYSAGQIEYTSTLEAQVEASSVIPGNSAWFVGYGWSCYNTNNSSNQSTFRCKVGTGYESSCKDYLTDGKINNGAVFFFDNTTPNSWKYSAGYGGENFTSGVQKYCPGINFLVNRSNAAENLVLAFKQGGTVVFGGTFIP